MADDRMKNDELQRNMGGAGHDEGQKGGGQQSPGRSGQGQQAGGKQGDFGGGQNKHDMEDDDLGAGNAQTGGQGRGGQNR